MSPDPRDRLDMPHRLKRGDGYDGPGAKYHSFVEQLQHRIIYLGYSLAPAGADGKFGTTTEERLKEIQRQGGLPDTGELDDVTANYLLTAEHERAHERSWQRAEPIEHPDGPAEPNFRPLVGNDARAAVFGRFAYASTPVPTNPEQIRYLDSWPEENVVAIVVPELARIPGIMHRGQRVGAGPKGGLVSVHWLVVDQMKTLWRAWDEAGLLQRVITWAGMWSPRFVRGSRSSLSNHAWATAFDLNAPWNGLGAVPAAWGQRGSVRELVAIAHEHRAYWGGHFNTRPDGMHFEFVGPA